jgi:ATP synthase protein I
MTTEPPPARPLPRPSPRVAGLGPALVATLVVAVVATGAAVVLGGREQVNGALVGAALVGGFFVFGTLSTSLAAAYAPRVSMFVALLTYTLQVVVLGAVLVGLTRSGATQRDLDVRWLAGVVITGTLAWMAALVVHAVRSVPPGEVVRR